MSSSVCPVISKTAQDVAIALVPSTTPEKLAFAAPFLAAPFSFPVAAAFGAGYATYKWATKKEPEVIYTPIRLEGFNLDRYARIAELQRNPKILGIALAPSRINGLRPIYIEIQQNEKNFRLQAFDLETNEFVGFLEGTRFHQGNNFLREHWIGERPKQYEGYGPSSEEVEKICIDQVTNASRTLKNIGVILIKAAQQAFPNAENRVILNAVRNTHGYYHKLGFRVADVAKQHLNAEYAKIAKSGQIPKTDAGNVQMYLPDASRQVWATEIQEDPIRFPTT